ncbi:helix-turn-helix domain-containing protein [Luteipulveratus mongoliensis]|uniref:HTH cro/C1-type domain-containing protein n=1 Tax=Luteipulveratus mongoliensis TaxID=571913 RepID=A0A0K1JHH7_9MICO|nr:helix-turn-helix transcriptional regulator [Luteipulveratus mongoliensis]AKU16164.1 hypothetical protein VV02_10310 [Luteipulveratus mongoliensis]
MDDDAEIERNRTLQAQLYGEPLGPLLRRLVAALGITQARLADVLGLSAPMLSQLASGRRVKIGNPAVVGRLRTLVDVVESGRVLDPTQLEQELARVHAAQAPLTGPSTTADRSTLLGGLRAAASPAQLIAAAQAVAPISKDLADLLGRAAGGNARG